MTRGIVYLASGHPYLEEAKISAKSVKQSNPSLDITLFTDEAVDTDVFDSVVTDEPVEGFGDNILTERHLPYDQNLYLDADTYVCGDLSDLFAVLEEYDLAAASDINRGLGNIERGVYEEIERDVPSSFPELNAGVMAYNDCTAVRDLFHSWGRKYDLYENPRNQPAFRLALYDSDVPFTTLTPEYNFRIDRVGFACGPVKILHKGSSNATEKELATFAELVNSERWCRVTTWDDYPYRVISQSERSWRYKLKFYVHEAEKKRRQDGAVSVIQSTLIMFSETLPLPIPRSSTDQ